MPEEKTAKRISNMGRLGFLSAAPRVSTNPLAEASGPRSHILGVMQAFKELGWEVLPYIVGDRIPSAVTRNSAMRMEKSFISRLAADFIRLISGPIQSALAWLELRNKVDIVYERFAVLQSLGWIFQPAIPWILETSGLYYYEATTERKSIVLNRVAEWIEKWVYRRCDILICVSDVLKDLIIRETGISPKKIVVVPNGVDCVRFDPALYRPERVSPLATIGFASALVRWHRLDTLIEAMGELHSEGVDYHLIVAGDGPMKFEWESLARNVGLDGLVTFLGHISWDKIPLLIAGIDLGYVGNNPMDIGVMYHSPLKLYEYMAMGKPVISTWNDDSRKMITNGETGYLFQAGDVEDLKKVLRQASTESEKWTVMGKAARQCVLESASWTSRVAGMLEVLPGVLAEKGKWNPPNG